MRIVYIIKNGQIVEITQERPVRTDADVVLEVDVEGKRHYCKIFIERPVMSSIHRAIMTHMCPEVAKGLQEYGRSYL